MIGNFFIIAGDTSAAAVAVVVSTIVNGVIVLTVIAVSVTSSVDNTGIGVIS